MWLLLTGLLLFSGEGETSFVEGKLQMEGFFDLYWDDAKGACYLAIGEFDQPFLFVNSLVTGLGSNDIGLDRGQMGRSRVVSFRRVGNKVFLHQPNLAYRADSDDPMEREAVAESFAESTLWGVEIAAEENGLVFVDLASFVFRDEHGISRRLKAKNEGNYRLDSSRCYYYSKRIKSFPDNSEVEVVLTFTGEPTGRYVATVTPTSRAITLRQRYSLVRLPDDGYQPRPFHPKSGAFSIEYRDYAVPLDQDLRKPLVPRHRLVRKKSRRRRSELAEPLVYHVDSGAPVEIQRALIEGASWWKEAFEAAGIKNGFRVELLPPGADPMDVRYNVIQWVHRSTRGWSYGGSVIDPRTGEIIKAHVTLGSLRVRQDRLIFEGVIPFDDQQKDKDPNRDPVALALARIRQLSAHEVGHTLGLAHNFAASNQNRASVMDYPAPLILLKDGEPDLSRAYDVGIGEWDKLAIRYLYEEFKDEEAGLAAIIGEAETRGLPFIDDSDSRSPRTMHPLGNLWDNGDGDPTREMVRVIEVRDYLLKNFSARNMRSEKPLSLLEEVLVPVYLHHRFQLLACAKNIGGAFFDYGANDGRSHYQPVPRKDQAAALAVLMDTLSPSFLDLPPHLRDLIPPPASGYSPSRETFERRTAPAFDELSLAETSIRMTLDALLVPQRLNRLYNQKVNDPEQLGIVELLGKLLATVISEPVADLRAGTLHKQVNYQMVNRLIALMGNSLLREDVRAEIRAGLMGLKSDLVNQAQRDSDLRAHYQWLVKRLQRADESEDLYEPSSNLKIPPGSPIGQEP